MKRFLLLPSLVAALVACESPRTQTMVRVQLDPALAVAGQVDTEIVIRDAAGQELSRHRERVAVTDFPLCTAVVPQGDDASRIFHAEVRLYEGEDVRAETVVTSGFVSEATRMVNVYLQDGCLHTTCEDGETCGAMGCGAPAFREPSALATYDVMACSASADAGVPADAMVDSAFDGGIADGGSNDGGTLDGGPQDGGAVDAGTDAGMTCDDTSCGAFASCVEGQCVGATLEWVRNVTPGRFGSAPQVHMDGDDAMYVYNSFSGVWTWDDERVFSHGAEDLVVARVGLDESPGWIRAIGTRGTDLMHDLTTVDGLPCFSGVVLSEGDSVGFSAEVDSGTPEEVLLPPRPSGGANRWNWHFATCLDEMAAPSWATYSASEVILMATDGASLYTMLSKSGLGSPFQIADMSVDAKVALASVDPRTGSGALRRVLETGTDVHWDGNTLGASDISVCLTVSFDGDAWPYESETYTSHDNDAILICQGPDGTHQWAQHLSGVDDVVVEDILVDNTQVIVQGNFRGTLNIPGAAEMRVDGLSDDFFAAFDVRTGMLRWAHQADFGIQLSRSTGGRLFFAQSNGDMDHSFVGELNPATGEVLWNQRVEDTSLSISAGTNHLAIYGRLGSEATWAEDETEGPYVGLLQLQAE